MVAGTAGTNFAISSVGGVHTFNLPDAAPNYRGVVTGFGSQTFGGLKIFQDGVVCDGWGIVQDASTAETTVWFRLDLDAAASEA